MSRLLTWVVPFVLAVAAGLAPAGFHDERQAEYKGASPAGWAMWLHHDDVELRRQAAQNLGEIGPPAYEAVPDLTNALHDEDKLVRRNAALALGKIGPKAKDALPDLRNAMLDKDRFVFQNAMQAIRRIEGREPMPVASPNGNGMES